jgi:hypothetical protein
MSVLLRFSQSHPVVIVPFLPAIILAPLPLRVSIPSSPSLSLVPSIGPSGHWDPPPRRSYPPIVIVIAITAVIVIVVPVIAVTAMTPLTPLSG